MKKKLLHCCRAGEWIRLMMVILLSWGCAGAWAESVQLPVGDSEIAAPAVDLGKLEKPQPVELTPSEMAQAKIKLPVVAMLDFETSTLDEGPVTAISQAVWARLKMRRQMAILPREATRRWLISVDLHPFTPYRTDIDMAPVAKALQVDYLVYGCVDYVGSTYLIDYSVYSAREGRLVMLDAQLRRMDLDQLVAEVSVLAQSIGDRIVAVASGVTDTTEADASAVPAVALTDQVNHKKPEQVSKVRIRKATVVEKTETPAKASVAPVAKEEPRNASADAMAAADMHGATEKQPVANEMPVIELKPTTKAEANGVMAETAAESPVNDTSGAKDLATTDKSDVSDVVQSAPKLATDPAREAFNKALALPKNSKERLAALKEAVEKDPKTLVYQRMLIDEDFRQGLYPECIEVCDQALALNPGDSLLLTVQGAAYFELNQLAQAQSAYEQAVASDPKNWYARYNLAQTLTVTKSPQAAEAWRQYIEVAGEDPDQATYLEEARRNLTQLGEK